MSTNLNTKLKEVRKALGFTQALMAERLNVMRGTIAAIETGQHEITMKLLERLFSKLLINPVWFFFDQGNMFYTVEAENKETPVLKVAPADVIKLNPSNIDDLVHAIKELSILKALIADRESLLIEKARLNKSTIDLLTNQSENPFIGTFNKKSITMPVLGLLSITAEFKVFINGRQVEFSLPEERGQHD